jgi:hypothetical protein
MSDYVPDKILVGFSHFPATSRSGIASLPVGGSFPVFSYNRFWKQKYLSQARKARGIRPRAYIHFSLYIPFWCILNRPDIYDFEPRLLKLSVKPIVKGLINNFLNKVLWYHQINVNLNLIFFYAKENRAYY